MQPFLRTLFWFWAVAFVCAVVALIIRPPVPEILDQIVRSGLVFVIACAIGTVLGPNRRQNYTSDKLVIMTNEQFVMLAISAGLCSASWGIAPLMLVPGLALLLYVGVRLREERLASDYETGMEFALLPVVAAMIFSSYVIGYRGDPSQTIWQVGASVTVIFAAAGILGWIMQSVIREGAQRQHKSPQQLPAPRRGPWNV